MNAAMDSASALGRVGPGIAGYGVPRARLLDRLLDPACDVWVVSGAAGIGKTTLLGQLALSLRQQGDVVIWLEAGPGDDEAHGLVEHLLRASTDALADVDPVSAVAAQALRVPTNPLDEGFLRVVVDLLTRSHRTVWLLLDDCQVLTTPLAPDALSRVRRLADRTGGRLNLVVSGRQGTTGEWTRELLGSRCLLLTGEDLALTRDEARDVLRSHGLALSNAELAELHRRTEGWAAGVRLAAISLAQSTDLTTVLGSFGGDRPAVADYLVSAVLRGLPDATLDFMVCTSGPARLTVDLAVLLTGRVDAGALLEGLCAAAILTTRTSGSPRSYRYHPLLRDYLTARAVDLDQASERRRHATIARHYASQESLTLAMEHAARSGEQDLLIELLTGYGLTLMLRGDWSVLTEAIDRLTPSSLNETVPAVLAANTALRAGSVVKAQTLLGGLANRAPAFTPAEGALYAATLMVAARLTGVRTADTAAQLASDDGDAESDEALFFFAMRGMLRIDMGDTAGAEADLQRALRTSLRRGFDYLSLDCMEHLVVTAGSVGDTPNMRSRSDAALAFASQRGWGLTANLASSHFVSAWVAWGVMDDEAELAHHLGIATSLPAPVEPRIALYIELLAAYVDFERHESPSILRTRVREAWRGSDDRVVTAPGVSPLCIIDVLFGTAAGDVDWVRETVQRAGRWLHGGDLLVAQAWQQLAEGEPRRARQTLAPVLKNAVRTRPRAWAAAWQAEAVAAYRLHLSVPAHRAVVRLLDAAEPLQLTRQLALSPPEVLALLADGQGRLGQHEQYAKRIRQAAQSLHGDQCPTVVPVLSEREMAILRELSSLMSLSEIARAHQVSTNTVKTQTKSLFKKLDVHGRRDAVLQARKAGLL